MPKAPIIVCFRQDLRLADQPALHAAHKTGRPVIPVYIHAPQDEGAWAPGGASRWWLHHSLAAIRTQLNACGSRMILRRGPADQCLRELIEETKAESVFWNIRYEPEIHARDEALAAELADDGIEVRAFHGSLLFEPGAIRTKAGTPYKVFTPFWRACLAHEEPPPPYPAPRKLAAPPRWPDSLQVEDLRLLPSLDWAAGIEASWQPGSAGAKKELKRFLEHAVEDYDDGRNRPDQNGTSRLSPYLHFGEIGPRTVWHALRDRMEERGLKGGEVYLSEIGWREFAHQLLVHFPHTTTRPLNPKFDRFPWGNDARGLRAWQQGRTGYPIVDAGMRQLWETGWMHNRVRMIVASFLVKDLLIPWQRGAEWFWDTLVDADLANNTMGWQWTAGCGADAAPYFRVFNPITQGEKFDPDGAYVRRYVPELSTLPKRWIHKPWQAPPEVLAEAGVKLGDDYPHPIVDHSAARDRALESYASLAEGTT